MIRKLAPADRSPLADILAATPEFSADEKVVAMELIDSTLADEGDYEVLVAEHERAVAGYICFGHTAMTAATYDLYWICVKPAQKGHGIGRKLVVAMEAELARRGPALVRVETESSPDYEATRAFYDRIGYERAAVFRDFYREGVDLVTYRRAVAAS